MHEINLQEIIDYAKCPMYYLLKYKATDLKTNKINIIEKYDKDIHKVIYYALSKVQEGASIDAKDIKSSWGRAWIKDKRKSNIIFGESLMTKDTYNDRRRKGIDSLLNFQREFNLNPGLPIVINKEYKIKITKNLSIISNFELIRSMNDIHGQRTEVMTFKTDEYGNSKMMKEFDLKLLADGIAAQEYIKTNISHSMHNVDKNLTSMYKSKDLNTDFFYYSVTNVFKAMYNKIYYMSNSSTCSSCIYKEICDNKTKIMEILDREGKLC